MFGGFPVPKTAPAPHQPDLDGSERNEDEDADTEEIEFPTRDPNAWFFSDDDSVPDRQPSYGHFM